MPSDRSSFTKLCWGIIIGVAVVVLAMLYWVAPLVAERPPDQAALLVVIISGSGFILVVGLMRWYGQRQAQRRREEQADEETVWDRVQRHLEQANAEEDSTDGPR